VIRVGIVLAALVGLAFVARAAAFYAGVDPIAQAVAWLIGAGLVVGTFELLVRATRASRFGRALDSLPRMPERAHLEGLPAEVRAIIEARLVGSPSGVASPSFVPYLVGLLVMLGLLGTFLGLFEALRGAREALSASGDVVALRAGLGAPMQGLARAFGTSAAGVTASSMLGLGSVFARRAEAAFHVRLHALLTGPLAPLTLAGRQLAALEALAETRESLPRAVEALDALRAVWERSHKEQLEAQRAASEGAFVALESASERTERAVLQASTRVRDELRGGIDQAAAKVGPIVEAAAIRTERATEALHGRWERLLRDDMEARRRDEDAQKEARRREAAEEREARSQSERAREAQTSDALQASTRAVAEGIAVLVAQSASHIAELHRDLRAAVETALEELRTRQAQADTNDSRRLDALDRAATSLGRHAEQLATTIELETKRIGARVEAITDRLDARFEAAASSEAARVRELETLDRGRYEAAVAQDRERAERDHAFAVRLHEVLTALRTTSTSFERDATVLATELRTSLRAAVDDAARAVGPRLGEAIERSSELARSQLDRWATEADREALRRAEQDRERLAALGAFAQEQLRTIERALESRALDAAEHEQARLEALTSTLAASERRAAEAAQLVEAVPRSVLALIARADEGALTRTRLDETTHARLDALTARLDDLIGALSTSNTAHQERAAALSADLDRDRSMYADRLAALLETHSKDVAASLTTTSESARGALDAVRAGGVELAAFVEMFAGAVDRYRDASERWLDNLSAIESAIEQRSGGEAVDLLGAYIEQTREVFDHALAFQRELFGELKQLRAASRGRALPPAAATRTTANEPAKS
jgi:hypothetical protein